MEITIHTIGGLGLFLLGMIVMTDGLKALAGEAIRKALMRFTRSPLSGAMTGAIGTAILQSSSATTVAAVGFVGAGLLGFSEALGIIFGANIGTTIKGWMVALIGFKFKLGLLVFPLIFFGALLRLFARGRLAQTGYVIAGFSLIFLGITEMQQGMAGLQGMVLFDNLPPDSWWSRIKLVFLGVAFTVITQSSSAGVAAALTALYTGLINFEQGAALVIGMDIGTTVTAALATLGANVDARRTGYSHVIYNCMTAIGALLFLNPFSWFMNWAFPGSLVDNAEIALVAFHTSFNTLGVIIVLPFTHRFARMMQRLVVEKVPAYTQRLEQGLLDAPELALAAVEKTVKEQFLALLQHMRALLTHGHEGQPVDMLELQQSLTRTQSYVDNIHVKTREGREWQRLLAMIHSLDHLQRLYKRCALEQQRATTASTSSALQHQTQQLLTALNELGNYFDSEQWHQAAQLAATTEDAIHESVRPYREQMMERIASDEIDVTAGTQQLEAIRWLRRVSDHLAHVSQHYAEAMAAQDLIAGNGSEQQAPVSNNNSLS